MNWFSGCLGFFGWFFLKINDSVEHFAYICSKALVKIKFSTWGPIKFLYVYLNNKELLISGVTCGQELFFQTDNTTNEMLD